MKKGEIRNPKTANAHTTHWIKMICVWVFISIDFSGKTLYGFL